MRDFPSCFGENGVQVADASCSSLGVSKPSQNCVTCLYKCKLLGKSCLISIVWSKNLMGQCLSVEIDDASHQCICKVDVKSSLFSKRKGPGLYCAILISKREHISGKRVYGTKAQFCDNGQIHDLRIECDANSSDDPCLMVRIDAKPLCGLIICSGSSGGITQSWSMGCRWKCSGMCITGCLVQA
ncbi:UNVERIFIED_CONTAM: hypothetical protein Sradi_1655100 [Sesamum radiatum]|uniref:Uncharacterized protein n=1 Tax=Sesamum radiatum TaxID=300843 RepID=A0AAW2UB67_SESRA